MSVLPVALNLQRELLRAELVATVGLDQARRLMPTDPPIDVTPAAGLDLSGVGQVLAAYKAVTDPIVFRADSFSDGATERAAAAGGDLEGSNNWVIDGTLSASGKPMLANDPHRLITLPSLRYLVHLHAPGWNVIGSGEPALPGVAVGHNERIAWGFTVVTTDQADLFVEETHPDDPLRYRVGDRWEAMTVLRESTLVRREGGVDAEPLELCFTRHGPVIHADRERNRAYALRWVGSEPGTAAYLASLSLDRAGNWREFLDAAGRWKTPSENVIYADVDGDIGWVAAALTPVRKGWQGLLPVPGASDTYDWQGFRNVEELPQMHNPRQHFVVTANHNILPPGYRHEVSYEWAAPFRARRLRQLLGAQTRFTLEDFERMQFDHLSLPAAELAALPAKVGVNDPSLAPFAELLRAWDGRLAKDSAAAALYVLWQRELVQAFFSGRCPSHLMEELTRSAAATVMLPELMRPTEAWFGADASAKRDQLVREALARAVATARQRQGDDPADWELGRVQQELFKHPLAGLGPSYARAFNIGPYSGGSGPDAPDQARHDKLDFSRTHGATYRQVFDLADWDKGLATSAPGQSGQPGSPHYDDLAPLWNAGEYFPLAFSREKVEEVTRHRLVLSPGP
jgi:penicillin amidase